MCDQKHRNNFTRRVIANGEKKGVEKITFNWISPAFTGHFVQQSSLCSLCLGDKAHYIIVVHCVLTVGPLPVCWEWISWAHCPFCKAWAFKVKRPHLITHTTYVDYRFLCTLRLHIINFLSIVRYPLLSKLQRGFKKHFNNKARKYKKNRKGRGGYGYWKIAAIFHL